MAAATAQAVGVPQAQLRKLTSHLSPAKSDAPWAVQSLAEAKALSETLKLGEVPKPESQKQVEAPKPLTAAQLQAEQHLKVCAAELTIAEHLASQAEQARERTERQRRAIVQPDGW